VPEVLHAQPQVAAHGRGRGERVARLHLLGERAPRQLHHRGDLRVLGRAHPGHLTELAVRGGKQARNAAEAGKQLAGQVQRALSTNTGSEEERDELRVRKRLRSEREQSFAGPLGRRPLGHRHAILGRR
jgi:hypothetical protein